MKDFKEEKQLENILRNRVIKDFVKPHFYVTIPSAVMWSDKLNDSAKLLYGLIANLAYSTGICYASNEQLATYRNVSVRSIQTTLSLLNKNNFIKIEMKNTSVGSTRIIKLVALNPLNKEFETELNDYEQSILNKIINEIR